MSEKEIINDSSLEDGEVASDGEIVSDGEIEDSDAEDASVVEEEVARDGTDDDVQMERQIVDGMEEGEVTADNERVAIDQQVENDLQRASAGVAQKDARYFTGGDTVICSSCGVKGHMSYMCEDRDNHRCFTCNNKGHNSAKCPYRTPRRPRSGIRQVSHPREPVLSCYVCHREGHLDCSVNRRRGILSCYNCGARGHTGANCNLPGVDVVSKIWRELLDRDRLTKKDKMFRRATGSNISKADRRQQESVAFKELLFARLRQRRFTK